jgi:hypothetical protein
MKTKRSFNKKIFIDKYALAEKKQILYTLYRNLTKE